MPHLVGVARRVWNRVRRWERKRVEKNFRLISISPPSLDDDLALRDRRPRAAMLTSSSTLRKSTATACLACARAASSASSSSPSPRRFLPATTRAVTPPVTSKRYTTSFAQPFDSIQTQPRLGEEQSRLNDEDSADQDAEQALADVYAAIEPAPPSPSPAAPMPTTLEALMAEKVVDQGPTVSDLVPLLPRRFRIPNASSPDSHRTIYRNTFDKTVDKLAKSFSKLQLFDIASNKRTGFGIDVRAKDTISKLKLGTPENKRKFWLPKRLDQMSKRELIHTILIVKNDMVHPGVVPRPNTGPSVTDSMSLSDRILFLLLSPSELLCRVNGFFSLRHQLIICPSRCRLPRDVSYREPL